MLTTSEINYIEKQVKQAEKKAQDKEDKKRSTRLKKAAGLIRKYPEYKEIFSTHYGENIVFMDYDGSIDFSPQSYQDIKAMRELSYDEYIELQINSFHKTKGALEQCYYNIPLHFKGHIKHINRQKGIFVLITSQPMGCLQMVNALPLRRNMFGWNFPVLKSIL